MAAPNPSTTHPAFDEATPGWTLCRDVTAGARAVKAKSVAYLPKPLGQSVEDYGAYKTRAVLFNAFQRTVTALAGVLLTRPLSVAVPDAVRPQIADLTLRDEGLDDVARAIVQEVLAVGRTAILLDMPEGGAPDARPYWCLLPAEVVTNWRTARVGNDPDQLVQVVIREDAETPADSFSHETQTRYRELALLDGIYSSRLWTQSSPAMVRSTSRTPWVSSEWVTPTRRGKPLDRIPFTFINASGITPDMSRPPMEDLADLIISHYRNSADLENLMYFVGMPIMWASGVTGDGPLKVGSSIAWMVDKDGRVGTNEMTGAGAAAFRELMAAKEKQMAVLGGRLLLEEPHGQTAETATSARLRFSAEAASLRTIAGAVSAALTRVLRWHVWWYAGQGEIPLDVRVDLGSDFFAVEASPDKIRAALLSTQAGEMSSREFFETLTSGGWVRPGLTFEQRRAEIARQEALPSPPDDDDDEDAVQ